MPIDLSRMSWLNPPPESREENGRLIARSGFETDFWQGTYYGFHRDSGHFLHQTRNGDFTAETSFAGRYEALYDQAGLMIRHDEKHWVKCGIEFTDGARHFSVVVTNGRSDWSAFRLTDDFEEIRPCHPHGRCPLRPVPHRCAAGLAHGAARLFPARTH